MSLEQARKLVAEANNCILSKYLTQIDYLQNKNKLYWEAIKEYERTIDELTKIDLNIYITKEELDDYIDYTNTYLKGKE